MPPSPAEPEEAPRRPWWRRRRRGRAESGSPKSVGSSPSSRAGEPAGTPSAYPRRGSALLLLLSLEYQLAQSKRGSKTKEKVPWILTAHGDTAALGLVLVYGGFVGFEVSQGVTDLEGATAIIILVAEVAFSMLFALEFALRAKAEGRAYVLHVSGIFDALLLLVSVSSTVMEMLGLQAQWTHLGVVRLARLLRICQITRIIRLFPELQLVSKGLFETLISVSYAGLPLLVVLYAGSLVCASVLGESDECDGENVCVKDFFGTVPRSLFTNVKLTLVEAWPDIAAVMFMQSKAWIVYIVFVIMMSNMVILKLIAYVVCGQLQVIVGREQLKSHAEEKMKLETHAGKLGKLFDAVCPGVYLEEEEYLDLLKSRRMQPLLKEMEVGLPYFADEAALLLDPDEKGNLSRDEWVEGVMRLMGTRRDNSSALLHLDLVSHDRRLVQDAANAERNIDAAMKSSITKAGWAVLRDIKALEFELSELIQKEEVAEETKLPSLEKAPWGCVTALHEESDEEPLPSEISLPEIEKSVVKASDGFVEEEGLDDALEAFSNAALAVRQAVKECEGTARPIVVTCDAVAQTDVEEDFAASPIKEQLEISTQLPESSLEISSTEDSPKKQKGWASDPLAAQRRRELLLDMQKNGRRDLLTAAAAAANARPPLALPAVQSPVKEQQTRLKRNDEEGPLPMARRLKAMSGGEASERPSGMVARARLSPLPDVSGRA